MTPPTETEITTYEKLVSKLIIEDDDSYHAKRSENITSSSLKDFIKNPKIYYLKHVMGQLKQDETEALYLGTLTHSVVLEGPRTAMNYYSMNAPINKDGREYRFNSKAFQEEQAKVMLKGKKLARQEDYMAALQMRMAIQQHDEAKRLLSVGEPERVVRGKLWGLPIQIKMDLFTPHGIIDLKTVADIERFHNGSMYSDLHKYGYLHSAAFYREALHQFDTTVPKQDFYFVVVEKTPPYQVGVWKVHEDILDEYTDRNMKYLADLKLCVEMDDWPDPYAGLKVIDF